MSDVGGWRRERGRLERVRRRWTANTRYSALDKLAPANVGRLKVAWALQLGSLRSQESTPLVVGDILYVTSSHGPKHVFAVDARTGNVRWRYAPEVPAGIDQFGCCDVNNRGVAHANGKIFVGRLDGWLVALDAATGKELWKTQVVDYTQGSVITSPPTIVKNLVITGFGGGEYGARGYIRAGPGYRQGGLALLDDPRPRRAGQRFVEGRFLEAGRRRRMGHRFV